MQYINPTKNLKPITFSAIVNGSCYLQKNDNKNHTNHFHPFDLSSQAIQKRGGDLVGTLGLGLKHFLDI